MERGWRGASHSDVALVVWVAETASILESEGSGQRSARSRKPV